MYLKYDSVFGIRTHAATHFDISLRVCDIKIPSGVAVKDSRAECEQEIPNGLVRNTKISVQYRICVIVIMIQTRRCYSNFEKKKRSIVKNDIL